MNDDIPSSVLEALRERGHSEAAIASMSAKRRFDEYCMWHGLVNWGRTLYELVHTLDSIDATQANKLTPKETERTLKGKK